MRLDQSQIHFLLCFPMESAGLVFLLCVCFYCSKTSICFLHSFYHWRLRIGPDQVLYLINCCSTHRRQIRSSSLAIEVGFHLQSCCKRGLSSLSVSDCGSFLQWFRWDGCAWDMLRAWSACKFPIWYGILPVSWLDDKSNPGIFLKSQTFIWEG